MKVAFLNRNPTTHAGGDLIMLEQLMRALEAIGVACENIYGEWHPENLHRFDVVHIQHCNLTWSKDNWRKTLQSGRPYVVSPIFYPTDALGMTYGDMNRMFTMAKAVCPLSFAEAREIMTLTGFHGPFHVIPHGTEARFHWNHWDDDKDDYVMCANARGDKGESMVQRVCKRLGLPFRYVRELPHTALHSAYRRAKVFVHSSPDDRMSLTVGEALCSGCRVISSTGDRGNEWYPGIVACDPQNEEAVEDAITMAWNQETWNWWPNAAARNMTWELAAERWRNVYERAVA